MHLRPPCSLRFPPALLAAAVLMILAAPAAAEGEAAAAVPDSAITRASSSVILPVLAYTPDTDLLFGGTLLRFFYLEPDAPGVRPSLLVPVFIRTTRSQTMAFLQADLNWDRGRRRGMLAGSFTRFPDQYYGLGRDARQADEEDFTPQSTGVAAAYEQRIYNDLRLGVGWRLTRYEMREMLTGGLLETSGLVPPDQTTIAQPELLLSWDSRDNTWSPRRGLYLQGVVQLPRKGLGSDHAFTGYVVDLRAYRRAGSEGTLAAQLSATWLVGDAPFYVLPKLGGQDGLRAYAGGRYLDAARVFGRVEWRSGPLWGRLGTAAFAGVGDVAPRLGGISGRGGLYTVGAGLRFLLNRDEGVSLRADFGVGNDQTGFTLTLGEAF